MRSLGRPLGPQPPCGCAPSSGVGAKVLGTFVPGSECSRERKFQGAKVLGNESSRERKFHNSQAELVSGVERNVLLLRIKPDFCDLRSPLHSHSAAHRSMLHLTFGPLHSIPAMLTPCHKLISMYYYCVRFIVWQWHTVA